MSVSIKNNLGLDEFLKALLPVVALFAIGNIGILVTSSSLEQDHLFYLLIISLVFVFIATMIGLILGTIGKFYNHPISQKELAATAFGGLVGLLIPTSSIAVLDILKSLTSFQISVIIVIGYLLGLIVYISLLIFAILWD